MNNENARDWLMITTGAELSRRMARLRRTVETNHEILANAARRSMGLGPGAEA